MRIGHASLDENGSVTGGALGDQTGREIYICDWFNKDWDFYIECTDNTLADTAAAFMEQICGNDNFGYSQNNRWTGLRAIQRNGRVAGAGKGDFDCSSLVLSCYILAGLNINAEGYTGNMKDILVNTGKFQAYSDVAHTQNTAYAKRGGIYLKEGVHVVMALDNKGITNENIKYKVQLGAFAIYQNATNLSQELKNRGIDNFITDKQSDGFYKVQVGAYSNYSNAKNMSAKLSDMGYKNFIKEV